MKSSIPFLFLLLLPLRQFGQGDSLSKIPFADMDLSWINGQNRQSHFPLVLENAKSKETILTGVVYLDTYFNYNLANPVDNTQTASSTMGRHKEFTVNLASIGVESYYKNVIGRLWLQWGQMESIIQDLDATVARGRNTSIYNLKYIREAAAGYHFNKWYGINVEAGIFMSYIGLESCLTQENWSYQRSMVCDFTPFYFSGARIQAFPLRNLKTELWILNGWQTYNSFSNSPGLGNSNYFRPTENLQLVANFYLGKDTYNPDTLGNQSNRLRFHHDNSIVWRFMKRPENKFLSSAALSLNTHFGFQDGMDKNDTITSQNHFMRGSSLALRLWFGKNKKIGATFRADAISNGGQYLAFTPSPVVPNDYTEFLSLRPEEALKIFQGTFTLDIMPSEHFTFRVEFGHRRSNLPFFAGHAGTTSPSGWTNGPATLQTWSPDLKKTENRISLAVNTRF